MAEENEIMNEFRRKINSMCARAEGAEEHDETICEAIFYKRLEQLAEPVQITFYEKYYASPNPSIRQELTKEYLKNLQDILEKILKRFQPNVALVIPTARSERSMDTWEIAA